MKIPNRMAAHGDFAQEQHATVKRYNHILVPCGLNDEVNISTLNLAVELAKGHEARLTILNVSPVLDDGLSVHWLDAIDRLYRALDNRPVTTGGQYSDSTERPGKQLAQFVYQHVPQQLRSSLDLHCISLSGDAANMTARYANDTDVDLVIMACRIPKWWHSALSSTVQRVMRLTRKQILLIRPET